MITGEHSPSPLTTKQTRFTVPERRLATSGSNPVNRSLCRFRIHDVTVSGVCSCALGPRAARLVLPLGAFPHGPAELSRSGPVGRVPRGGRAPVGSTGVQA
ncbi:hypothetical protein ACE1SV_64750 [Streptomyces sp. E-15]